MSRCLLEDAGMSNFYWAEAVTYANYIINRTWSAVIDQTPFYKLYGYKPDISNLRIFGSFAEVNIPLNLRKKGGPVSERRRFVGFDSYSKYYRFADKNDTCIVSNSAKFEEDSNWSRIHSNDTSVFFNTDIIEEAVKPDDQDAQVAVPDIVSTKDDDNKDDGDEKDQPPRRSKRTTKGIPPKRYQMQVSQDPKFKCNKVFIAPENFSQIKYLPESEQQKWYDAMQIEMDSLDKLNVYKQVRPPLNKPVIGTRWVYKIKQKPNGEQIYKARLVAQGFAQRYPEDFTETFSPTVRTESVKIALTTALALNLQVYQFDVETAYLNADLKEEIYVKAAPGFQNQQGDVWFLNKSLYGLKQSALMWHRCLVDKLKTMGFIKSQIDECVFTKKTHDTYEVCLVYVDDIVYIGPNKQMSDTFAKGLEKHFTLKSLGHIHDYLGVQIVRTEKGFSLTQENKIEELLAHCNMSDAKPNKTPMQTNFYSAVDQPSPEFKDQTFYRSVIGSLLYISRWTRPDISFSVNVLSRYSGKATQFHWTCIKRLLRYMKHTKHKKLLLEPSHNKFAEIICYADSDWASDIQERKSTSGNVMFLNNCPIFWKVHKQSLTSRSSTEAEYATVSEVCNLLTDISYLIKEIWEEPSKPIALMEDNTAVGFIAEAEFSRPRSRHIHIRYENVREYVRREMVKIQHVPTTEQIADVLTKPLPREQHEYLSEKLQLM